MTPSVSRTGMSPRTFFGVHNRFQLTNGTISNFEFAFGAMSQFG